MNFAHHAPTFNSERESLALSDPRQQQIERTRHAGRVERLDEQARVADLPAAARAEEAAELRLRRASALGRLLLQRAEGPQLALRVYDPLDRLEPEGADQLVLEVVDADEEALPLEAGAAGPRAEAGALEAAPEVLLLAGVAQPGEFDVQAARPEPLQLARDRLGAADRHDADPLGRQVAAAAPGERLDGCLVAQPLHQDDAAQLHCRIFAERRRVVPVWGSVPNGSP